MTSDNRDWIERLKKVARDLFDGIDKDELIDELIEDGWDKGDADKLVESAERALETDDELREELEAEERDRESGECKTTAEIFDQLALDLHSGDDREELIDELVDDGWDEDEAIDLVESVERALKTDVTLRKKLEREEITSGRRVRVSREAPELEPLQERFDLTQRPRSLRERITLTLGLVVALWIGKLLPTPVLDMESLWDRVGSTGDGGVLLALGPLNVGLGPYIAAFVIVELGAMLLKPHLRHGDPEFRKAMIRNSIILGVILAAIQGWSTSVYIESSFAYTALAMEPGGFLKLVHTLSVVAGSCIFVAAAFAISRAGVGNGFAVIIAANLLWDAGFRAVVVAGNIADGLIRPIDLFLSVSVWVGLGCAVLWFFIRKSSVPAGLHLRVPTCGTFPFDAANALVTLPASLALLIPPLAILTSIIDPASPITTIVLLTVTVLLVPVASIMFYWRWRKYLAEPDCKPHWHRAWLVSALFLAAIVICQRLAEGHLFGMAFMPVKVLSIIIATAIAIDLYHEVRARKAAAREGRELLPFEVHQDMSDALEAADRLSAAQPVVVEEATYRKVAYDRSSPVPIVIQGLHFRSLFYFFAPFTPLVILGVPPTKGLKARVKAQG